VGGDATTRTTSMRRDDCSSSVTSCRHRPRSVSQPPRRRERRCRRPDLLGRADPYGWNDVPARRAGLRPADVLMDSRLPELNSQGSRGPLSARNGRSRATRRLQPLSRQSFRRSPVPCCDRINPRPAACTCAIARRSPTTGRMAVLKTRSRGKTLTLTDLTCRCG